MASLTDLRGRIVRCDTSISKLSSELRNCSDSIKQINGQQQDNQNRQLDRIHNLESKVNLFCKLKSFFHFILNILLINLNGLDYMLGLYKSPPITR